MLPLTRGYVRRCGVCADMEKRTTATLRARMQSKKDEIDKLKAQAAKNAQELRALLAAQRKQTEDARNELTLKVSNCSQAMPHHCPHVPQLTRPPPPLVITHRIDKQRTTCISCSRSTLVR